MSGVEKKYQFCVYAPKFEHYSDGMMSSPSDFFTDDNYLKLKEDIGEAMVPKRKGTEIVILSLTVIG